MAAGIWAPTDLQVERMTGRTVSVDLLREAGADELARRAVQIDVGPA